MTIHKHHRVLVVASIASLFNLSMRVVAATITPVSQARQLQGDTIVHNAPEAEHTIDTKMAPDFGPFADTLIVASHITDASATAQAFQQSTITSCTLSAHGTMNAEAVVESPTALSYVIGHSMYRVTFDIDQRTGFQLSGYAQADSASRVTIILTQSSNGIIVQQQIDDATVAVSHEGTLAVGRYTLDVTAFAGAATQSGPSAFSGASMFNIMFTVCTAPGDVNHDGQVNVDDLVVLITSWGGCPPGPDLCPADINDDQSVNIDDLVLLITSWDS